MVKGKAKNVETKYFRTEWKDPIEVQAFCELCAAQVLQGNMKGSYLRLKAYEEVRKSDK